MRSRNSISRLWYCVWSCDEEGFVLHIHRVISFCCLEHVGQTQSERRFKIFFLRNLYLESVVNFELFSRYQELWREPKTRCYPVSRWLYSFPEVFHSDSDSPLEGRIATCSLYPRWVHVKLLICITINWRVRFQLPSAILESSNRSAILIYFLIRKII